MHDVHKIKESALVYILDVKRISTILLRCFFLYSTCFLLERDKSIYESGVWYREISICYLISLHVSAHNSVVVINE